MQITISPHAAERLIDRHRPDLDQDAAMALLAEAAATRRSPVRDRTIKGDLQWRLTDPDVLVVVKRDSQAADGWVVVTVLPAQTQPVDMVIPDTRIPPDLARQRVGRRRSDPPKPRPRYVGSLKRIKDPAEIAAVVQAESAAWAADVSGDQDRGDCAAGEE